MTRASTNAVLQAAAKSLAWDLFAAACRTAFVLALVICKYLREMRSEREIFVSAPRFLVVEELV